MGRGRERFLRRGSLLRRKESRDAHWRIREGNCQAGSGQPQGEFRDKVSPELGGGCGGRGGGVVCVWGGSVKGGHELRV